MQIYDNPFMVPNAKLPMYGYEDYELDKANPYNFDAMADRLVDAGAMPSLPMYGYENYKLKNTNPYNLDAMADRLVDAGVMPSPQHSADTVGDPWYRNLEEKFHYDNIDKNWRPHLQIGGSVLGGLLAAPAGLGVGSIATGALGSGLGFAAGNEIADILARLAGKPESKNVFQSFKDSAYNVGNETMTDAMISMATPAMAKPFAYAAPFVMNSIGKNGKNLIESALHSLNLGDQSIIKPKIKYPQLQAPMMTDEEIKNSVIKLLNGEKEFIKTGHLTADAAQRILEKTGYDLSGFNIALTMGDTRHPFRHHGDGSIYMRDTVNRPIQNKEIFLTLDDMPTIAKLPNIFDDAYPSSQLGPNGELRLIFVNSLPSGLLSHAEMRTGYGNLVPVTNFHLGTEGMKDERLLRLLEWYKQTNMKK